MHLELALIFIFRLRFPPGISIATIPEQKQVDLGQSI